MSSFYERLLDFARTLQPPIAIALLKAMRELAFGYKESAMADAIASGNIERVSEVIASATIAAIAFVPVRSALRDALVRSAIYIARDTPKGTLAQTRLTAVVRFNALDPAVARAAAAFETPLLNAIGAEVREGVKAAVREQIARGVNPRIAARELRGIVGLSSNHVTYVENYRTELEALSKAALQRQLTDGRIDRTVAAAIRDGKPLTAAQIDRATTAYVKNLKVQHAETLTRTASINAMKEGQRLAWQQAIDAGRVDGGELIDTWHTTMDGRERPSHHEMHLKTKRFDQPWFVPGVGAQDYPGQSEFNCRCVVFTRPRIRRASEIASEITPDAA